MLTLIQRLFGRLALFVLIAGTTVAQAPQKASDLPDLKASVLVRRDARAIPYIDAKNDEDLYFVQGFVTASDRLWQMDILRRRARGETAEIFGRAALEDDKIWRRYGFAVIAEENLKTLAPEMRSALDRYAAGVNAYIATLTPETMPVEFKILQYSPREWKAVDTIVVGKILAEALSSTWYQDLQRAAAMAALPPDKFRDLTNQVTPYDVVLFGKDAPVIEPRAQMQKPARKQGRNIQLGNNKAETGAALTDFRTSAQQMPKPAREQGRNRTLSIKPSLTRALPHVGTHLSPQLLATASQQMATRDRSLAEIGLYAEDLAASNNWVISGKLTADGKPLLANDPHLAATAPGIWYMAHLATPSMRVAGVTFPGVPGIVLGHNEHFAWGATNVGPDVQDLYLETFNAEGKYKTPTGWESPIVRKEEIKVRLTPLKPDTETTTLEVVETRNGVINVEDGAKKYALKWT
ncbi:MAG: penicillin acylase family protein, partial [Acidobacteria bacterium]|nr:penicillin acylase family protein [Acidobacteriota bacterium]